MSLEKLAPRDWRDLVYETVYAGRKYKALNVTRNWLYELGGEGWVLTRHDDGMYQMIMDPMTFRLQYGYSKENPTRVNEWGEESP